MRKITRGRLLKVLDAAGFKRSNGRMIGVIANEGYAIAVKQTSDSWNIRVRYRDASEACRKAQEIAGALETAGITSDLDFMTMAHGVKRPSLYVPKKQ